jgi:hypothetical protein
MGVGVPDIEKRCNAHRMSGNAFCIFDVGRYTCMFGLTDEIGLRQFPLWLMDKCFPPPECLQIQSSKRPRSNLETMLSFLDSRNSSIW